MREIRVLSKNFVLGVFSLWTSLKITGTNS